MRSTLLSLSPCPKHSGRGWNMIPPEDITVAILRADISGWQPAAELEPAAPLAAVGRKKTAAAAASQASLITAPFLGLQPSLVADADYGAPVPRRRSSVAPPPPKSAARPAGKLAAQVSVADMLTKKRPAPAAPEVVEIDDEEDDGERRHRAAASAEGTPNKRAKPITPEPPAPRMCQFLAMRISVPSPHCLGYFQLSHSNLQRQQLLLLQPSHCAARLASGCPFLRPSVRARPRLPGRRYGEMTYLMLSYPSIGYHCVVAVPATTPLTRGTCFDCGPNEHAWAGAPIRHPGTIGP